jgi:hypothetical protein
MATVTVTLIDGWPIAVNVSIGFYSSTHQMSPSQVRLHRHSVPGPVRVEDRIPQTDALPVHTSTSTCVCLKARIYAGTRKQPYHWAITSPSEVLYRSAEWGIVDPDSQCDNANQSLKD